MSESLVARARRHVAEAKDHIARQKALIAKLSKNKKHAALIAPAKEILHILQHTLSLARDHLTIELEKYPSRE
jgi:PHD/YefM family antitoxin component YafN of YafNO toxin-antitoxin module